LGASFSPFDGLLHASTQVTLPIHSVCAANSVMISINISILTAATATETKPQGNPAGNTG